MNTLSNSSQSTLIACEEKTGIDLIHCLNYLQLTILHMGTFSHRVSQLGDI